MSKKFTVKTPKTEVVAKAGETPVSATSAKISDKQNSIRSKLAKLRKKNQESPPIEDMDDRKPSAEDFDDRKPSAEDMDDRKPSAEELEPDNGSKPSKTLKLKKKLKKLAEEQKNQEESEKKAMPESDLSNVKTNGLAYAREVNPTKEDDDNAINDLIAMQYSDPSTTAIAGTKSLKDLKKKKVKKDKKDKKEKKVKEDKKETDDWDGNNHVPVHDPDQVQLPFNIINPFPNRSETNVPSSNNGEHESNHSSDDEFRDEEPPIQIDTEQMNAALDLVMQSPQIQTDQSMIDASRELNQRESNEPFPESLMSVIYKIVDGNVRYVNTERETGNEAEKERKEIIRNLLNLARTKASINPTKAFKEDEEEVPLLSEDEMQMFQIFRNKLIKMRDDDMTDDDMMLDFKDLWYPMIVASLGQRGQRFKVDDVSTHATFVNSIGTAIKKKLNALRESRKEEMKRNVIANQETKVINDDQNQIDILVSKGKTWRSIHKVGEVLKKISNEENKVRALTLMWLELMVDSFYTIDQVQQATLRKHVFTEIHERAGADYIQNLGGRVGESLRRFRDTFGNEERINFCFSDRSDIMVINPCDNYPFRLEEFQKQVLRELRREKHVLMVAPTSCGKTICAMDCIRDGKFVVMLYPTSELALQAAGTVHAQPCGNEDTTPIIYIDGTTVHGFKGARVIIGTPKDVDNFFMLNNRQDLELNRDETIQTFDELGTSRTNILYDYKKVDIVVVDEFQQVNADQYEYITPQSTEIQKIMMLCTKAQFMVLSATIRNPDDILAWIRHIKGLPEDSDQVVSVIYNRRFINQERWAYTDIRDENGQVTDTKITRISCLSVVTVDMISDGCLARSEMQFPPNQLPELGRLVHERTGNPESSPYNFFADRKVSLLNCKDYEDHLKQEMTQMARNHPESMQEILNHYVVQEVQLQSLGVPDLYKILIDMKKKGMLKVMIFIFDQYICRHTCYELLAYMIEQEAIHYPLWYTLRTEQNKRAKVMQASLEKAQNLSSNGGENAQEAMENRLENIRNTALREYMEWAIHTINLRISRWSEDPILNQAKIRSVQRSLDKILAMQDLCLVNENEPHPDYTFSSSPIQRETMRAIKEILNPKKMVGRGRRKRGVEVSDPYRPALGYKDPYMMCAERGMTVYTNNMRELDSRFQGLAQAMLNDFGVQVIFSDASYAFGVNLPVTSVMFYNPNFNEIGFEQLSVILAHQAQGRGARRGLDTKGYVIYVGTEYKRLMLGEYLDIRGNFNDGKGILSDYITAPTMFNNDYQVSKLKNLSIAQWYEASHERNVVPFEEKVSAYIERNTKFLKNDLLMSFDTLKYKPCHMYRFLGVTDKAFVLQDFFAYIGDKSQRMSVDFREYEIIRAIASIIFPDSYEESGPVLSYDKFQRGFMQKCEILGKDYDMGQHVSYAKEVKANTLLNITDQKIRELRFIIDIMEVLYTNNLEAFDWRRRMCACHMHMCNLVFKQVIEWGTLEERGTRAIANSDIPM